MTSFQQVCYLELELVAIKHWNFANISQLLAMFIQPFAEIERILEFDFMVQFHRRTLFNGTCKPITDRDDKAESITKCRVVTDLAEACLSCIAQKQRI